MIYLVALDEFDFYEASSIFVSQNELYKIFQSITKKNEIEY